MDSPVSTLLLPVGIVLGAIALVTLVSAVLERRYARWVARSPRVERLVELFAEPAPAEAAQSELLVALGTALGTPPDAPSVESSARTVSADAVRRIVDPSIPSVHQSHPWRPTVVPEFSAQVLGYDASKAWTREESDGLVALVHLGTDLRALAAEMRVDDRVLVAELARRLYGAVDPVVDPTCPRTGRPWRASELSGAESVVHGACLSETAARLGRDQLDVVSRLIRDGRRTATATTAR
jgi:hypothetical protein